MTTANTPKLTKEQVSTLRNHYLSFDVARLDLNNAIDDYNAVCVEKAQEVEDCTETYNDAVNEWNDYLSELRDMVQDAFEQVEVAVEWAEDFTNSECEEYYFAGHDEIDDVGQDNQLLDMTDSPGGQRITLV